jgi:hypothetical protein
MYNSVLPSTLTDVSDVNSEPCSERTRLSHAIAQAVKDVDGAKADHDRARSEQKDTGPSAATLTEERKQARRLVAALDQHRKEHGC